MLCSTGKQPQGRWSWAYHQALILFILPSAALLTVIAIGAVVNEEHRMHAIALLEHRQRFTESRPDDAEEQASGKYVRTRAEEMLEVAERLVAQTEPMRAFGLQASPLLLKAAASTFGSILVAVVTAAYNSQARGFVLSTGKTAG